MRILVATNHLDRLGGTETYTYALAAELKRRGHTVHYHTNLPGVVSERMERDLNVSKATHTRYDLALANHLVAIELPRNCSDIVIQTCHGVFPELEQPSLTATHHVAISAEVQNHLGQLGFSCVIIENGVNTERFSPQSPLNDQLSNVLSLCQSLEAHEQVADVCERMGVRLVAHDKNENPVWDVEARINQADLVIGLGRSAYEAMACGRPVIVFDHRPYNDGLLDGYAFGQIGLLLRNNFSGRFHQREATRDALLGEFEKYDSAHSAYFRRWALGLFDIRAKADLYLSYATYTPPRWQLGRYQRERAYWHLRQAVAHGSRGVRFAVRNRYRKLMGRPI